MADSSKTKFYWGGLEYDPKTETYSARIDFSLSGDSIDSELTEYAAKWGVIAEVVSEHGPGGGWPDVKITGTENALLLLLEDYHDDAEIRNSWLTGEGQE